MTMTTLAPPPAGLAPTIFDGIVTAVNAEVLGRATEIRAVMLALVARQHVFVLSEPGEAKTMLEDRILKRIDGAVRFSTQLDPFSSDSALFGNWSVKRMAEDDVMARSAKNHAIQHAHVADIDELPRASGATLMSLMRILNEGEYMSEGRWQRSNLSTMVATGNSLPWAGVGSDKDRAANLEAIWDRIGLRLWMARTTDLTVFDAIMRLPKPDPDPAKVLAWSDVEAAQAAAARIPISDEAHVAHVAMVRDLVKAGLRMPSPRRGRLMLDLARANAWLGGATKVQVHHLDVLSMVFPHQPDEQAMVDSVVFGKAAPLRSKITAQTDRVATAIVDYNNAAKITNDTARTTAQSEAYGKIKRSAKELASLQGQAGPGDMPYLDRAWPALQAIHDHYVVELLHQAPDKVTSLRTEALAGRLG